MKQFILFSLVAIIGCLYSSCVSDNSSIPENSIIISEEIMRTAFMSLEERQSSPKTRLRIDWAEGIYSEFGRKSKDCEGFGICSVLTIERSVIERNASFVNNATTMVEKDEDGNIFADFYLKKEFDNKDLLLPDLVIEDEILIGSFSEFEQGLILNSGSIKIDRSLGSYGGYRIYFSELDEQKKVELLSKVQKITHQN